MLKRIKTRDIPRSTRGVSLAREQAMKEFTALKETLNKSALSPYEVVEITIPESGKSKGRNVLLTVLREAKHWLSESKPDYVAFTRRVGKDKDGSRAIYVVHRNVAAISPKGRVLSVAAA